MVVPPVITVGDDEGLWLSSLDNLWNAMRLVTVMVFSFSGDGKRLDRSHTVLSVLMEGGVLENLENEVRLIRS